MNNLQLQTKIFLGAVAGIMVARSFAPTNAWYLIPIGIAIWWAGTHKRKLSDYLIFSFSYAILFWLTHISWLLLVGIDAYVLLSILMSLIYGFSGYLMFKVRNLPLPFVWYAIIFISIESLTDYFPFGGFPWGKIAYASADAPWAGLFAIGSAPLVTLTILAISSMLIPAVGFLRQKAISPAIFFIILIFGFNLTLSDFKSTTSKEIGTIDMAIIQGSVPRAGLLFNEQKMEVLKYHVDETENLLTDSKIDIDVILWPENSIDIDPFKNPEALNQITNTLKKYETPLLSGAVLQQDTGLANSVLLWNEKTFQVEDSYIKSILVPFGEYLPFRSFLSQ
jgi:apolipoprotein N-acyltransferase